MPPETAAIADALPALAATLADAPARALLHDALALLHLAAMAAGLGLVIATDLWVLRRMGAPLGLRRIASLCRTHVQIARALSVLWASGLGLAALALTAPEPAPLAKLAVKLAVVGALTATALAMRAWVLPVLAEAPGRALLDLPLRRKCWMAVFAGLSTGGWASALALGGAGVLAGAEIAALAALAVGVHALAIAGALAAVLLTHDRRAAPRAPSGVPAE